MWLLRCYRKHVTSLRELFCRYITWVLLKYTPSIQQSTQILFQFACTSCEVPIVRSNAWNPMCKTLQHVLWCNGQVLFGSKHYYTLQRSPAESPEGPLRDCSVLGQMCKTCPRAYTAAQHQNTKLVMIPIMILDYSLQPMLIYEPSPHRHTPSSSLPWSTEPIPDRDHDNLSDGALHNRPLLKQGLVILLTWRPITS